MCYIVSRDEFALNRCFKPTRTAAALVGDEYVGIVCCGRVGSVCGDLTHDPAHPVVFLVRPEEAACEVVAGGLVGRVGFGWDGLALYLSEDVVFGKCRRPAARASRMFRAASESSSRTVRPAFGIHFVLGDIAVAIDIDNRSIYFRLDSVRRKLIADVRMLGRVHIDRVAFQTAEAVEETFRLFAVSLSCGCGAVCFDIRSDVVAVYYGRGVVCRISYGCRIGVSRNTR